MKWQDYIHRNPKILLGKPVFIGTRLSVEMILEEMAAGASEKEIIESYPHLSVIQIRAALAYSAHLVKGVGTLVRPKEPE